MYPYIHIGPLSLGTFGIFMWLAFLAAFFALAADFSRRHLPADPQIIVGGLAIAGLIGAKLWHLLEEPSEFLAAPASMFFSRTGFAWFGGFIAGIVALIWFARHYRIPLLALMDACAPATAMGYAVGRLGCLISGDGDYGKPTTLPWGMAFPNGLVPTTGPSGTCAEWGALPDCRVHPTPIYEFIVGVVIFYYLWRLGGRLLQHYGEPPHGRALTSFVSVTAAKPGYVVAQFFILSGLARFLVEFIRINPRSVFGLSNAQAASLASIVLGIVLLVIVNRRTTHSA